VGCDSVVSIMTLRARRSGNWILVGVRFLRLSKLALGPAQPTIQRVPHLSQG